MATCFSRLPAYAWECVLFNFVTSLEYLSTRYSPTLSVPDVSEITGEHEQTIRNRLSAGDYPIASFKIGKRRLFRLQDIAAYIDQMCLADASHPSNKRPKPGRPTKIQQLAKRQAQQNSQIAGS